MKIFILFWLPVIHITDKTWDFFVCLLRQLRQTTVGKQTEKQTCLKKTKQKKTCESHQFCRTTNLVRWIRSLNECSMVRGPSMLLYPPVLQNHLLCIQSNKQLLSHDLTESSHSGDHFLLSSVTFHNSHSQFNLSESPSDSITASSGIKTDRNQYFYHSKNDHFHHMWCLLLSSVA